MVSIGARRIGAIGARRLLCQWIIERLHDEDLDGEIRVNVDRAHVRDHLAPRRLFDDAAELISITCWKARRIWYTDSI
jgi:hypothetical protein